MNMLPTSRDQASMLSFFHLTVFEAMMRLKSVTMAADELDLPQSSLSRNLQTLREHFNDQLFVRTRNGMVPTSVAQSVAKGVEEALIIYRTGLCERRRFDPGTSERNFRIAASDLGHYCIMPLVQRHSVDCAPNISFTAVPIGRNKLISEMEAGAADVAIGSYPNLYANVKEQTLFREDYVCILPKTLAPDGILSLSDLKALDHIVVDGRHYSHGHQEAEQRILETIDKRRIRMVSETFMVTALIAEMNDLVLTIPRSAARVVRSPRMTIVAPPLELPVIEVKQYWHERFDHDPGNMWLRTLIAECRVDHQLEARQVSVKPIPTPGASSALPPVLGAGRC
ncbi:LysR family transcriptional regulator [Rhizorhabdus dicambivorans]|uniref:LysR family transcriptional regulator n=1 Tax=Rhizorhabdus dicambivorans TaxID=1850238 RepID=A0A2A4FWE0_9SPHN|nr:LysR family transcriptional regulator [Rhizorhabdus dicambivorans]ATE63638.1 LysR family transcriptional regulator [Rhizorhabdus dicambivorans]PCE42764.1 LysR family transcriptional regulator [Rhizorhabdus dicambivorans]